MNAEQFRTARRAMGHSQASLASELGISKRTIERIENGEGATRVMELAMAQLADRWRGIESAPKDGTRVLLFDAYEREIDFARFVGAFDFGGNRALSTTGWYAIPGAFGKRPTHWMPLPDAPA